MVSITNIIGSSLVSSAQSHQRVETLSLLEQVISNIKSAFCPKVSTFIDNYPINYKNSPITYNTLIYSVLCLAVTKNHGSALQTAKEFGFYVNNATRTLVMPMVLDTNSASKLPLLFAYLLL